MKEKEIVSTTDKGRRKVLQLETKRILGEFIQSEQLVDDVYSLSYESALVPVRKIAGKKIGGLPITCLLPATRFDRECKTNFTDEDENFVLLRVERATPLPNGSDADRYDSKAMDPITARYLKFPGRECRVPGTFYLARSKESSDVIPRLKYGDAVAHLQSDDDSKFIRNFLQVAFEADLGNYSVVSWYNPQVLSYRGLPSKAVFAPRSTRLPVTVKVSYKGFIAALMPNAGIRSSDHARVAALDSCKATRIQTFNPPSAVPYGATCGHKGPAVGFSPGVWYQPLRRTAKTSVHSTDALRKYEFIRCWKLKGRGSSKTQRSMPSA